MNEDFINDIDKMLNDIEAEEKEAKYQRRKENMFKVKLPACNKHKHKTRMEANVHLARVKKNKNPEYKNAKWQVYWCKACKAFHITHEDKI